MPMWASTIICLVVPAIFVGIVAAIESFDVWYHQFIF
jgi:hypothetical protein